MTYVGGRAVPSKNLIPAVEYGYPEVAVEDFIDPIGNLQLLPEAAKRYVKVDFKDNTLRLQPQAFVGIYPVTHDRYLKVEPRFPIANLTHMVTVTGGSKIALDILREYPASDKSEVWMREVMIDALLAAIDPIRQKGLIRAYERKDAESSFPHGRIDIGATLSRHVARGSGHVAQFSWYERSIDNLPNKVIKSALVQLGKFQSGSIATKKKQGAGRTPDERRRSARLTNAIHLFQGVTIPKRSTVQFRELARTAHIRIPESRTYYREALDLSVAVLDELGFDLADLPDRENLRIPSIVIEMEKLFEQFVRVSLATIFASRIREGPTPARNRISILDGNSRSVSMSLYSDSANWMDVLEKPYRMVTTTEKKPKTTPDIVVGLPDGWKPIVADMKYKPVTEYISRSDLEQVIVYATKYVSPVAMTIRPASHIDHAGLYLLGTVGEILVADYRIDLGADNLNVEMGKLADAFENLVAAALAIDAK
ncbi:5-methylcytosine restriction system specificity protein McrC [Nocardia aurantia]|uniref:Restriction endonuclease n=1 Tax=Nocardia aurantia TaxID=2585199 RepID=A0A7K0DXQ7_9NOCA|nr:hypothetical protein [Nocardia aurantia]MQY29634.1 hypothetical protein [Nocardia aurantia]